MFYQEGARGWGWRWGGLRRPGQRPRQRAWVCRPVSLQSSEEKICLVSWCLECCSIRKTDAGLSHEVSVSAEAGQETLASIHGHSQTPDAPLTESGRSVQGDSTAGSRPTSCPESPPSPPRWRRGSRGGGPGARFQPGRWAFPASPPSQARTQESVARAFLFHCLWPL